MIFIYYILVGVSVFGVGAIFVVTYKLLNKVAESTRNADTRSDTGAQVVKQTLNDAQTLADDIYKINEPNYSLVDQEVSKKSPSQFGVLGRITITEFEYKRLKASSEKLSQIEDFIIGSNIDSDNDNISRESNLINFPNIENIYKDLA